MFGKIIFHYPFHYALTQLKAVLKPAFEQFCALGLKWNDHLKSNVTF